MSGAQTDDAGAVRRSDLVIRFAGEAGEGIKSPGELVIQAASRAGYRIISDFSPPAEIKGGVSFFQMRLSTHRSIPAATPPTSCWPSTKRPTTLTSPSYATAAC